MLEAANAEDPHCELPVIERLEALVEHTGPLDHRTTQQPVRRRDEREVALPVRQAIEVDLRHVLVAAEVLLADLILAREAADAEPDVGRRTLQGGHLPLELLRQPFVVIILEREQLAARLADRLVSRGGCSTVLVEA